METVDLDQAEANLLRLVERAAAGEEIVIAKAGKPVARLVPLAIRKSPRKLGVLEGQIRMSDDFDDPLPEEIAAAFRGERP